MMLVIKKFFVDEDKLRVKMANRKTQNASGVKEKKKSRFQEKLRGNAEKTTRNVKKQK